MFGLPLHALVRVLFWLGVLALLLAVLVLVMRKLRESAEEEPPASGELLSTFRELHAQGGLSDEEYQTIRRRLAARMQDELNQEDDTS